MGIRTMSIQEGLNELNTLDKRIAKALSERNQFGAVVVGERTPRGFDNIDKFKEHAKSKFQSIIDLLNRRTAIKRAIVKKNSEVIVTVAEEEMTIAEAIERKNSIVKEKQLLANLQQQYNNLMYDLQEKEEYYRQRLDSHVENIVGKDQKEKFKNNEEVIGFFKRENEPHFIDPIVLNETIEKMEKEIEEFENKVDYVLTRANITNDIEFEDPTVG